VLESFGSTTCREALSTPSARRGLQCSHVPCGTEHTTRQEGALISPRTPRNRACHSPGKGFGVATWPEAPNPSPSRRGHQSCHVPHGSRPAPCTGRLRHHHLTEAPGPPPSRAPVSPCVLWLQTRLLVREGSGSTTCPVALGPGRAHAFPRCLASGSSWPHQAHGADTTLNAYVTGHMQRVTDINCVQDINAAGR
jgi:hypothetical protein